MGYNKLGTSINIFPFFFNSCLHFLIKSLGSKACSRTLIRLTTSFFISFLIRSSTLAFDTFKPSSIHFLIAAFEKSIPSVFVFFCSFFIAFKNPPIPQPISRRLELELILMLSKRNFALSLCNFG